MLLPLYTVVLGMNILSLLYSRIRYEDILSIPYSRIRYEHIVSPLQSYWGFGFFLQQQNNSSAHFYLSTFKIVVRFHILFRNSRLYHYEKLRLSQVRTWISNVICRGLFLSSVS